MSSESEFRSPRSVIQSGAHTSPLIAAQVRVQPARSALQLRASGGTRVQKAVKCAVQSVTFIHALRTWAGARHVKVRVTAMWSEAFGIWPQEGWLMVSIRKIRNFTDTISRKF